MKATTFLGFTTALLSATTIAAPVQRKREIVYNTVVQEVIETVVITTTVWVDPPSATDAYSEVEAATVPETTAAAFYESPAPAPAAPSTQAAPVPAPAPTSAEEPAFTPPAPAPAPVAPVAPEQPAAPVTPEEPAAPEPAPVTPEVPAAPVYTPPTVEQPAPVVPAPAPIVSSPAPAPEPSIPSPPSTGSGQYSGEMTYYQPGMGACGITNGETDWIVAIAKSQFDEKNVGANPNNNGWCGQKIKISYMGEEYEAAITDRCEGCKKGDLDMPVAMFDKITQGTGNGRTYSGMTWDLA